MPRNYQKYKRIDTDRYSKSIKSSFWSLISISIGLLFTYLALTKPPDPVKKTHGSASQREKDYSYTTIGSNIGSPEEIHDRVSSSGEKHGHAPRPISPKNINKDKNDKSNKK